MERPRQSVDVSWNQSASGKYPKPLRVMIWTGISAFAAGGFVAGLVWAECGNTLLGNVFGRLFIGCVFSVLSMLTLGFPPRNEGGVGPPYNAWPYIIGCWLLFLVLAYWRHYRRRNSRVVR